MGRHAAWLGWAVFLSCTALVGGCTTQTEPPPLTTPTRPTPVVLAVSASQLEPPSRASLSPAAPTAVAAATVALTITGAPSPSVTATSTLAPTVAPSATTLPTATWTPTASPTVTTTMTATDSPERALARAMFNRVNAERAKSPPITPEHTQGQPAAQPAPLVFDERLTQVAGTHARDMGVANYMAHADPEGKSPEDRIRDAHVAYLPGMTAENIYQGFGDDAVQEAMDWFMQDPTHRDAILDPRFTHVGIGVYVIDEKVYFVQNFIAAPPLTVTPSPSPTP